MGLSASQARLLSITSRKADCEFMSMMLSHQKIGLSRDMETVSDDYQKALSQTKLVYDYYGANNQQSDLSYNLLMSPSVYNDYSPKFVTNLKGNVVLNGAFAAAARAAGIPNEGYLGTPSSDVRNKFIMELTNSGVISNATAMSIQGVKYNNMAGLGASELAYSSTMDITYDQLLENIKANCYSTEESGLRLGGFYALQDNEFADWYLLSGRGKAGIYDDNSDGQRYTDLNEDELAKSYAIGRFNDQSDMYYGTGLYVIDSNGNECATYLDRWNLEDNWDGGHVPLSSEKHSYDLTLEELLSDQKQFNFTINTAGQATSDLAYIQQLIVGNEDPDNCSFLNWMTDQFKIVLGGSDDNNMALQYAYNAVYDLIYPNEDAQEMAGTKDMCKEVFGEYYEYIESPIVNYAETGVEGTNKAGAAGDYYSLQKTAQNYLGIVKSGVVIKTYDPTYNGYWVSPTDPGAQKDSNLVKTWNVYYELAKAGYVTAPDVDINKYLGSIELFTGNISYFQINNPSAALEYLQKNCKGLYDSLNLSKGLPYMNYKTNQLEYASRLFPFRVAPWVYMGAGDDASFRDGYFQVCNPFHMPDMKYVEANSSEGNPKAYWKGNRQAFEQCFSIKLSLNLNNLAKLFLTAYTEYMNGVENSKFIYNKNEMKYLNLYDPNSSDVFTIPGETTIDNDDNLASNFYDTIFNLICTSGWSENTQIEDKDYMQNMLKSGLMLLSSISSDQTYYQQSYASDVYVVEVTDSDAVAQAEAKYNSEKNKIEAKENKIDLKMKNLDTELSSLSTEYDTVKSLINKTIEKTIKRYDA